MEARHERRNPTQRTVGGAQTRRRRRQYALLARKPRRSNGRTWIIWPGSWTTKPGAATNWHPAPHRGRPFPLYQDLDQFDWTWPKKINRAQVQNLFRLAFLKDKTNVIFLGGVGLGKTHLASALAHEACLRGHAVLFTTAVDIINTLTAAQTVGRLKHELKRYLKPTILVVDELGYLPIDKTGADLLFQVISQRYEQGSIVLTTNQPYKHWPKIFNNDSTLTSAVLDRLLHHAETVVIEGKSYRMKDQIETP